MVGVRRARGSRRMAHPGRTTKVSTVEVTRNVLWLRALVRSGSSRDPELAALETPLTRAGAVMGTPGYMPPEQM